MIPRPKYLAQSAYDGKAELVMIAGDVIPEEDVSKKGKKFTRYSIPLVLADGKKGSMGNLMENDLSDFTSVLGEDTTMWKGKMVKITVVKDGEYYRWKVLP